MYQRQHQLCHLHHMGRFHPRCDSFVAIASLIARFVNLLYDRVNFRLNLRADLLGSLFDLCEDAFGGKINKKC